MNKHMTDTVEMLNKLLGHAKNPYLFFGADQSSIFCMYLVRKYVSRAVPVLFIDTKHHFEEVYLFLKKLKKLWGIDIVEKTSPSEQGEQPTKPSKQECCQLMKAHVLEGAIRDLHIDLLVTGMQPNALRSSSRKEFEKSQMSRIIVNPIETWPDDEVRSAVKELNLPRCSLWASGLDWIDCEPCTKMPESIATLNDSQSERQEVMRKLNSLGYC